MTGISVSAVTAYTAHREWASRPPDERFASVHALFDAAPRRPRRPEGHPPATAEGRTAAGRAAANPAPRSEAPPSGPGEFRPEAAGGALTWREPWSRTAALTHWSFGQLA